MARLILKSPYLKCDGNHSVSGYLRYIGTRERVEILPDDRPPTRKQEQLVRKLVKDFPSSKKLGEYSDYETKPTKHHQGTGRKLAAGSAVGRLHEVHCHPSQGRAVG